MKIQVFSLYVKLLDQISGRIKYFLNLKKNNLLLLFLKILCNNKPKKKKLNIYSLKSYKTEFVHVRLIGYVLYGTYERRYLQGTSNTYAAEMLNLSFDCFKFKYISARVCLHM